MNPVAEKVWSLTLEILRLLAGEDCIVVRNRTDQGTPKPDMTPPPRPPKLNRSNEQKILALTNAIVQLLTGEEWGCLEDPKDRLTIVKEEDEDEPLEKPDVNVTAASCSESSSDLSSSDSEEPSERRARGYPHSEDSRSPRGSPAYTEGYTERGDLASNFQAKNPSDRKVHVPTQDEVKSLVETKGSVKEEDVPSDPLSGVQLQEKTKKDITRTKTRTIRTNFQAAKEEPYFNKVVVKEEEIYSDISTDSEVREDTAHRPAQTPRTAAVPCPGESHDSTAAMILRTICGEDRPFHCPECGKCFVTKSRLLSHQKNHTGDKPFACPECGKGFFCNSHLVRHQRLHTGEKPFPCSECGKCFSQSSNLAIHQRIHTGDKPFACSVCDKRFVCNSHLVIHRRIHTGEKPFACSECGKCFISNTILVAHMRVHSGEKPYGCSVCGRCFTRKSDLVAHERIHTGEKPFACSECGKCFTQSSCLVSHRKIHAGEKPFVCAECGKRFAQKSDLETHGKTHAGQKSFICSECGQCYSQYADLLDHQRCHKGLGDK